MFSTVLSRSFNHATSLLVLASIAGCFDPSLADSDVDMDGEELTDGEDESETEDEPDESSSGMADPSDGMELLSNGSFEAWSNGMPQAWTDGDATLEELLADGVDGDRAVRVRSTTYNSVGQRVVTPLPAGSCLDLDLSVRWESGSAEAPVVQLLGRDEADMDREQFADLAWSGDGQWRDTRVSFVTAEAWTSFSLHVISNAAVEQDFSIDGASLRLVPCE